MARSGLLVSLFLALLPVALGADASLLCGILDARGEFVIVDKNCDSVY